MQLSIGSASARHQRTPLLITSALRASASERLLFAGTLARTAMPLGRAFWEASLVSAPRARDRAPHRLARASRLPDRGAREALTLYVDGASLLLAALVALLHPLGYVALALFVWMWWPGRGRDSGKYAGLRILGR